MELWEAVAADVSVSVDVADVKADAVVGDDDWELDEEVNDDCASSVDLPFPPDNSKDDSDRDKLMIYISIVWFDGEWHWNSHGHR